LYTHNNDSSVLKNFLSSNLISLKPVADWQREIEEQYKKLRGTANIQAKVAYLELIKRVPLYGAYFCNVTVGIVFRLLLTYSMLTMHQFIVQRLLVAS